MKIDAGRLESLIGISEMTFSSLANLPETLVAKLERATTPELKKSAQHVFFTPRYLVVSRDSFGFYLAQLWFNLQGDNFAAATVLEKQDILIKHPDHRCFALPELTDILKQGTIFMQYAVAAGKFYSGQILALFDPAGNAFYLADKTKFSSSNKVPSGGAKVLVIPEELTFAEALLYYPKQDPDLKKLIAAMRDGILKPFIAGGKHLLRRTDLNTLYDLPADTKVI